MNQTQSVGFHLFVETIHKMKLNTNVTKYTDTLSSNIAQFHTNNPNILEKIIRFVFQIKVFINALINKITDPAKFIKRSHV